MALHYSTIKEVTGRTVTIAYSTNSGDVCLLGNLEHNTSFELSEENAAGFEQVAKLIRRAIKEQ